MVYARAAAARPRATCRHRSRTSARFCIADEEVLTLADAAMPHRGPLPRASRPSDADGHRVGEGWHRRQAVHRAGAAGNGGIAEERRTP